MPWIEGKFAKNRLSSLKQASRVKMSCLSVIFSPNYPRNSNFEPFWRSRNFGIWLYTGFSGLQTIILAQLFKVLTHEKSKKTFFRGWGTDLFLGHLRLFWRLWRVSFGLEVDLEAQKGKFVLKPKMTGKAKSRFFGFWRTLHSREENEFGAETLCVRSPHRGNSNASIRSKNGLFLGSVERFQIGHFRVLRYLHSKKFCLGNALNWG